MGRDGHLVWQPAELEEAWELGSTYGPDACYVSGGTWLRIQWEAGNIPRPRHLVRLDLIPGLYGVAEAQDSGAGGGGMRIGAMMPVAACMKDPRLVQDVPLLGRACSRIAAPAVREFATLGGNIATAGDVVPALLALRAGVEWFDGDTVLSEPLEDWLQKRSSRQAEPHRILVSVVVPRLARDADVFYVKLTRRETFVPSVVTVAGQVVLSRDGCVQEVLLSAGGATTPPLRLRRAEECLCGRPLSTAGVEEVYTAVRDEFVPNPADPFASPAYCREAAANLIAAELLKIWKKHEGGVPGETRS